MRRLAPILLIAFVAAGCGGGGHKSSGAAGGQEKAVTPSGRHVKLSTPGVPKGERTVPLRVITAKGRDTVALVPVYIDGRGPFAFALDTGAAQSLIDVSLVRSLGLRSVGQRRLEGITGGGKGLIVQVKNWRAGRVRLHPDTIASFKLMDGRGGQPAGLLGSDVLSRFGKIAVDYDKDVLLLDPPVK
jgi:hypothetical protein